MPTMPSDPTMSSASTAEDPAWRARLLNALPWLWLGLSAVWAVVIVVTDQLAWPLAVWIATTVGPLTAMRIRLDPNTGAQRSSR
jgi:hypothetical protein